MSGPKATDTRCQPRASTTAGARTYQVWVGSQHRDVTVRVTRLTVSLTAWLRPAAAVLVTAAAGGAGRARSPRPPLPRRPARAPRASPSSSSTAPSAVARTCPAHAEGGGRTADRLLKDTGHALTYLQRFPAFVCRIDGVPADDPCVNTPPADAYWGLWWSDGESGKWSYSSLAAGSLTVPAGGYVAMVWDGSSGDVRPHDRAPRRIRRRRPTPTEALADPGPDSEPDAVADPDRHSDGDPTATAEPTASRADPDADHHTKKPKPSKTPTNPPSRRRTDPADRRPVGRAVGRADRPRRSARRPGRPGGRR